MDSPREQVLFGAAYYHEYQPSPRLDTDLDLMAEADFSVIRVGESVWTSWEPEDGRFDLEWLAPVLDGAAKRGIRVILGTPTYAAPPWLARRYPEIAGETGTGVRMPWGGRQEIEYTHPAFKFYAERVIRKIISRYADHPAVVGYQVDNEPGMMLFHNRGVFQRFVDELRHTYGDVETLNEAWGLVYWSHKLTTWADLWTPDGNWQPQYDLAWRTFQAKLTTEFIAWQAEIVREYARDDQFVTTCIAYERPTVDDANLTRALDVTAGNPYYAMQDALAVPTTTLKPQGWTTSGAWSLFLSADRMYASKQARFLITETNAGVRYQEFSNLSDPLPLVAESDSFDLSPEAQAIDWSDGLISQGSKVILSYDHPHFGQFPAVVSTEHGRGRITTVGTLPNPALAADLVRWLAPQQQERWSELPESVTVNSATNRDGQRIHVVHNWSWQPVTLTLPQPLTDVLDNESQPVQEIALGPWDVRVLAA